VQVQPSPAPQRGLKARRRAPHISAIESPRDVERSGVIAVDQAWFRIGLVGSFLLSRASSICWITKTLSRIGIISDTHGLLRPEAERRLAGVAHIIHAGDIGRADVMAALRRIAPVTAIRGNIDQGDWASDYAETEIVNLEKHSFYILHDLQELQIDPVAGGIDVVISGHSHRARIDTVDGVLYLNPGSAGPRRFKLPVTLATIDITPSGLRPEIHDLGLG
jgi:putative phosphoesterase